jgi:hypothetical protein
MKEEFKKLFLLNGTHLPVHALPGQLALREDYYHDPDLVCPAADPNVVSDSQRYNQAVAITQRSMQVPGYDPKAVEQNFLKSLKVDAWETMYVGFDPAQMPKDVKLQIAEMKMQSEQAKLQQAQQEFVITMMEQQRLNQAQILMLESQAKKFESDAASEPGWQQIEMLNALLAMARHKDEALTSKIDSALKALQIHKDAEMKSKELDTNLQIAKAQAEAKSASTVQ